MKNYELNPDGSTLHFSDCPTAVILRIEEKHFKKIDHVSGPEQMVTACLEFCRAHFGGPFIDYVPDMSVLRERAQERHFNLSTATFDQFFIQRVWLAAIEDHINWGAKGVFRFIFPHIQNYLRPENYVQIEKEQEE